MVELEVEGHGQPKITCENAGKRVALNLRCWIGDEEHPELLEDRTSITAIAVWESGTAFVSADIDTGIWRYGPNLTREVVMAKLTEEAKTAIEQICPSLVATASKIGKPKVSAKGSLRILDDEHVLFADIASTRTFTNIKENPQVAVICPCDVRRGFTRLSSLTTRTASCMVNLSLPFEGAHRRCSGRL